MSYESTLANIDEMVIIFSRPFEMIIDETFTGLE